MDMCEILPFATTQMDLESNILLEKVKEDKYSVSLTAGNLKKTKKQKNKYI